MHFKTTALMPSVGVPANAGRNKNQQIVGGDANKQLFRVMRLTAILLLAGCLQVSAKGFTQGISLSVKNTSLEKVFSELHNQTGYAFFYDLKDIKKAKRVSLSVKNKTLEEVLDECLRDQALTYTIVSKTVVIKPKGKETASPNDLEGHSGLDPESSPPPIDITGRVTDENGNPLSGASVKVKNSNKGTTTNNDGVFTLKGVSDDAMLEISYVGYEVLNIPVNSRTEIVTSLKQKPESLNEVVINKGYYTEKQMISTSNVGTVRSKDLEKQPINNPLLALQGRIPGILITQASGYAGSAVKVQVQGQISIGSGIGSDPLYVIDGVPFPSRSLYTLSSIQGSGGTAPNQAGVPSGTVSPLSFINPADIESIDVLKDADATAIYGSRAANGAILITTKKGKAGKTKVDFNLQTGIGQVNHFLSVLNAQQYLAMRHEALANEGLTPGSLDYDLNGTWDTTRSANWQKVLIGGTAHYTDLEANTSGGTLNTQFLIGGGYHKETTVFPGDLGDQKGSLHFNINNVSPNQKFHLQLVGSYLIDENRLIQTDLTGIAVTLSPVAPELYKNGTLNWAQLPNGNSTWINPLSFLNNQYSNKTNNLIGNLVTSYQIAKGLDVKGNFGYNNLQSEQFRTFPLQAIRPERRASTVRKSDFSNSSANSWIIEPEIDYNVSVNKVKINGLVGTTILETSNRLNLQSGSGYTSDLFIKDIGSAPTKAVVSGFSQYNYNAFFGRLSGNWDNKYIINLTGRRDGSSRFGSENLFHNFGSIAGAWVFSKESFFIKHFTFLSFGKLRATYGTTGNDQIGDYRFLNLYNSVAGVGVAYQNATGLAPNGLPNPHLQWEETKKMQFGLDVGVLSDRISLTSNYYQNRCSNQLLSYNLPIVTGFGSLTRNFPATIQNSGWEFSLVTSNFIKREFTWSSNFNITFPKNKLLSFPGIEKSSYAVQYVVGQPVTITPAYHLLGVDPTTGTYIFRAKDGSVTSSPTSADLAMINTSLKFYGGIRNDISYRGFELDVLFQFVKQIGPNYFSRFGSQVGQLLSDGTGNQPINVLNRWQKPGEIVSVQKFYISNNTLSTAESRARLSDASYSDASYIRMKNASISWRVPERWKRRIRLQDAKIFLQGQNLVTITKYSGMDPEILGSQTLPPLRVITIGTHVNF